VDNTLKTKYIDLHALSQFYMKHGDSHFCAGLIATKKRLKSFTVKDGSNVRF
jgi:hypothetical protein